MKSILLISAAFLSCAEAAEISLVAAPGPGETVEVQFTWEKGTGRLPLVFISSEAEVPDEKRRTAVEGEPRFEAEEVSFVFDAERATALQKQLYESGYFTGKRDGKFQHIHVGVVRVSAAAEAEPGVRKPVFVHVVSGTGRGMLLRAEIRVVVQPSED